MATSVLTPPDQARSRIVHRLAILIVCLVWPLIWVGGLVTTYDAGMAVPDWPNTYGYNLFAYPYKTWLLGPFDLFIEHGHRLLGAIVGFVAIGIAVATNRKEPRRWVFGFALFLLAAVIFQGLLGGIRVVAVSRTLAMVHGCTIGDGSLIGIGATVLNRAVIGKNCLIGAHALVTEGKVIPDNSVVMGSPGKVIKTLTPEQAAQVKMGAQVYVANAKRFR